MWLRVMRGVGPRGSWNGAGGSMWWWRGVIDGFGVGFEVLSGGSSETGGRSWVGSVDCEG